MNLPEAMTQIAQAFDLDADALLAAAEEHSFDRIGWDGGKGDAPIGSLWTVEGKILYALIRVLQPSSVLEMGAFHGASTVHLAGALAANGSGKLTSVDNGARVAVPGGLVPDALQGVLTQIEGDGVDYLKKRKRVDFVFEDMEHERDQVAAVAALAAERLTTGGMLVSHDAAHHIVGAEVRAGFADAGLEPLVILVAPSDCGLALWRKGA